MSFKVNNRITNPKITTMKKVHVILAVLVCVLLVGLYTWARWEATKPIPAKSCQTSDQGCELAKDWSAIKILKISDTLAVDAFAQPIVVGQWYLRSRITKLVFPAGWRHQSSSVEAPSDVNIGPQEMEWAKSNEGFLSKTVVKVEGAYLEINTGKPGVYAHVRVLCLANGELLVCNPGQLTAYFHPYKK